LVLNDGGIGAMLTVSVRCGGKVRKAMRAVSTFKLRNRFTSWYRGLPAVSRDRRFSMSEIEAALKTQGQYISSVLLELGWRHDGAISSVLGAASARGL
jgi:hypothetical protein